MATLLPSVFDNDVVELFNQQLFNDSSLTSYYRLESSTITDSKGSNTGTNHSATFSTGMFGNCAVCTNAPAYVEVPNAAFNWGTSNWTIHFWFKMAVTNQAQNMIVSFTAGIAPGFAAYYDGATALRCDYATGKTVIYNSFTPDLLWHMCTITADSTNGHILYLDGINVASTADTTITSQSSGTIGLGTFLDGGSPRGGNTYSGSLDDVAFFTRALTQAEITQLYVGPSESYTTQIVTDRFVSVSDTESVTDAVTDIATINISQSGTSATATISSYKWLTSTLLTTQQRFAVRPALKVNIIDDTIIPNTILTAPNQPLGGQVVAAPDGNLIAVGQDSSGNLGLWVITNGATQSQWAAAPTTIVAATGTWATSLNVSVGVSGYIKGTYVIDIAYFTGSSSNWSLNTKRSLNGGITFGSGSVLGGVIATTTTFCAVGQPLLQTDGTITGTVFGLRSLGQGSTIAYNYYNGTSWSGSIFLSTQTFNTQEWNISSMAAAYNPLNGYTYIVFSGYHTIYDDTQQNSLYLVVVKKLTGNASFVQNSDEITLPQPILTSLVPSNNPLASNPGSQTVGPNINNWTLPQLNFDGTLLWLTFQGTTASAISDSGVITQSVDYYLSYSKDWEHFTYPSRLYFTDGTQFGTNNSTQTQYSFASQGLNYYLAGSGLVWQYVQNQIVADVTNDVLGYNIQETGNAPSSSTVDIGNQQGKWYGPSPTQTGASAISKNKKIIIYQGYYNSNGIIEYAPRNTYYIDDVLQQVTSQLNDLSVQGRDFYKKLKVTLTKWAYQFNGPDLISDTFANTIGNWSQVNGSAWTEAADSGSPYGFWLQPSQAGTQENIAVLANIDVKSMGYWFQVTVAVPDPATSDQVAVYALWVDSSNWLRIRMQGNGGTTQTFIVEKNTNGTVVTMFTSSAGVYAAAGSYIVLGWRYYNYQSFTPYYSIGLAKTNIGTMFTNNFSFVPIYNTGDGTFNISGVTALQATTSIGLSSTGFTNPANPAQFGNFKFIQYKNSNNIKDLSTSLGTLSQITDYKFQNTIEDYLFLPTNWTGTFSVANRIMTIPATDISMYNIATVKDAMIEFDGKMAPINGTSQYGFNIALRSSTTANVNDSYIVTIRMIPNTANSNYPGNFIQAELNFNALPGFTTFNNIPLAVSGVVPNSGSLAPQNNLNIDLTQWHHYSVTMSGNWIHLFIDEIHVLSFFDNNVSTTGTPYGPYLNAGYFGFQSLSNGALSVKNITSSQFYPQIKAFALHPGDDIETALTGTIDTVRGWYFSDLWGRMKSIILSSTDSSTYTYQTLLSQLATDLSDKETVMQITVVGQGVTAVVNNASQIGSSLFVRENVIIDYTITTYAAALQRAQQELTNANKMQTQYTPIYQNNLGSEMFDVATIINTDANINAPYRIYGQQINYGQGSNADQIQIAVGTIS